MGRRNRSDSRRGRVVDEREHRYRNRHRAHRRWSIGRGRRNRSNWRWSRVLEERLSPVAVVDEDVRGKRREECYGHDGRRFRGHGQTMSSITRRVLTMRFTPDRSG